MKFLMDAHLPLQLAKWLRDMGYETIHTLELPNKNKTDDQEIIARSIQEEYIVITKDEDFYNYFILKKQPYKIRWITTGNIDNRGLIKLFEDNFEYLKLCLQNYHVVEINNESVTVHF